MKHLCREIVGQKGISQQQHTKHRFSPRLKARGVEGKRRAREAQEGDLAYGEAVVSEHRSVGMTGRRWQSGGVGVGGATGG